MVAHHVYKTTALSSLFGEEGSKMKSGVLRPGVLGREGVGKNEFLEFPHLCRLLRELHEPLLDPRCLGPLAPGCSRSPQPSPLGHHVQDGMLAILRYRVHHDAISDQPPVRLVLLREEEYRVSFIHRCLVGSHRASWGDHFPLVALAC